jgi:hypothetical protein
MQSASIPVPKSMSNKKRALRAASANAVLKKRKFAGGQIDAAGHGRDGYLETTHEKNGLHTKRDTSGAA